MKIIKSGIFKGQTAYRSRKAKLNIDENCPYMVAMNEGIAEMMRNCPIPEEVFKRAQGIK